MSKWLVTVIEFYPIRDWAEFIGGMGPVQKAMGRTLFFNRFKAWGGYCFHSLRPSGWPLVREKSEKFDFSSRSGKSQGILQVGQGNFKYQESQGKVGEFHNFGPKYVL